MKWLVAAVLASGCFNPNYDHPACPTGRCPSGLACVAGFCEATQQGDASSGDDSPTDDAAIIDAMPDASAMDTDGDGVANTSDNCPTKFNANQNDEDMDTFGDVCDPCPIDANNADGDMDGVGDMCDPNPMVGGDTFTVFEGFGGTTLPAGWNVNGTWTVSGGQAKAAFLASTTNSVSFPAGGAHETVNMRATITNNGGAGDSHIGIGENVGTGSVGTFCNLQRSNDTGTQAMRLIELPVATGSLTRTVLTTVELNVAYRLQLKRTNGDMECRWIRGTTIVQSGPTVSAAQPQPRVAMYAFDQAASFDWIMVVTSP